MPTTDAHRPAPSPAGRLRSRVARRPLTAFLVLLFAVRWPLVSVPALTAHGVLPGGPLPQEPFALGTTLLVMLPAALWVTAVADGAPPSGRCSAAPSSGGSVPAGGRRCCWPCRCSPSPPGWSPGPRLQTGDLLATLGWGALSVLTAVLLVHLLEETVWAGFCQGRLRQRHGLLPAAALTAVPFAAVHLPLSFTGDLAPGRLALSIGGLLVLGVLMRLLGATVRGAAGSLLAAGLVHATFNAANNEGSLVDDLLGGGDPSLYAVVAAVLFTGGALLALRNGTESSPVARPVLQWRA